MQGQHKGEGLCTCEFTGLEEFHWDYYLKLTHKKSPCPGSQTSRAKAKVQCRLPHIVFCSDAETDASKRTGKWSGHRGLAEEPTVGSTSDSRQIASPADVTSEWGLCSWERSWQGQRGNMGTDRKEALSES